MNFKIFIRSGDFVALTDVVIFYTLKEMDSVLLCILIYNLYRTFISKSYYYKVSTNVKNEYKIDGLIEKLKI